MSFQQEMHYKETKPQNTVNRLKGILHDLGIEVEEDWSPVSTIGTHSLRINIKGTRMGTNGKGVSHDFAMASAYAEFFERFQNVLFDLSCIYSEDSIGFRHFADEKIMNAYEIAGLDNRFMDNFFTRRGLKEASLIEKASAYSALDKSEYYLLDKRDAHEVRPYYNVTKKRIENLPFVLSLQHYGSNGMCAGNSPEEAIVQGLSEILERHVQKTMMKKRLCFPDVPEEVVAKYPYVYEMYKKAKAIPGHYIALKDCSMGGKFPVAALILVKKDTGTMGIKFGCHPDFGIAMERTFTEASQGLDVQDYAGGCVVDFANTGLDDVTNITNSFKFGTAVYPYQLLSEKPDYAYTPVADTSAMSNREILKNTIRLVENEGFEVWVRDVSYLGFPSFHIVVPGMSEIFDAEDIHFRAANTRAYLAKYINRPSLIDENVCRYLSGMLEFWSPSKMDNQMRNIYTVSANFKWPGEEIGMGWLYLSAMCYAYRGEYDMAAVRMLKLMSVVRMLGENQRTLVSEKQSIFYAAVYHYFSAMDKLKSHREAMAYIRKLYSEDTAAQIDEIFADRSKILVSQYPEHNFEDKQNCPKNGCCDYHEMLRCTQKIKEVQVKNPILQESLASVFNF